MKTQAIRVKLRDGEMGAYLAIPDCTPAGAIIAIFFKSLASAPLWADPAPTLEGGTIPLGRLLFTQYLLPFEIVSVLLLVAVVGVVLLSKRELK